jgi:hypothetical protein
MARIGPTNAGLAIAHIVLVYAQRVPRQRDPGHDALPDLRDGLTRLERVILRELAAAQHERAGRDVPSALLYGRVVEHVSVSPQEFQRALTRLVRRRAP